MYHAIIVNLASIVYMNQFFKFNNNITLFYRSQDYRLQI